MTQLSGKRRERRRHRWYEMERPTLLVRLRLVTEPHIVNEFRDTTWIHRDVLRRAVAFYEAQSLNPAKRS